MKQNSIFSCRLLIVVSMFVLSGSWCRGPIPANKTIFEHVADPTYAFERQSTIGFVPIYWHNQHRNMRKRQLLSDAQQKELFGTRLSGMKAQPIFWEPGDSTGLTELQEKQMFGYVQKELQTRGYSAVYIPLERASLHGRNTSQILQQNDFDVYSNSLENELVLPDSLADTAKNAWFHEFYLPLRADKLPGDSILVRYRGPTMPDMIIQSSFWQVSGIIMHDPEFERGYSTQPPVGNNRKEERAALAIRLDVWADPPYYKNQVWSGTIIRASNRPNLKDQAAQMISELLSSQDFPSKIVVSKTK